MKKKNSQIPELEEIARFLETKCHCTRYDAKRPPSLPTEGRWYALRPSARKRLTVRFDQQIDIALDGLVLDMELGSIGLIYLLDSPEDIRADITQLIEHAAYLRHVLGQMRSDQAEPDKELPYIIELVLIEKSPSDGHDRAVAKALRDILRNTALPHAVAINLDLVQNLQGPGKNHALANLFCWLLPATANWYAKGVPKLASKKSPPAEWDRVVLNNFRRPGLRRWKKYDKARLHVLHGPNGSGKSTLAEAFEFLFTGDSTRLRGPLPSRLDALAWRPEQSARPRQASVQLFNGKKQLQQRTSGDNPTQPKIVDALGDAFRLNWDLANRLTMEDPIRRSADWLAAFFPGQDKNLKQRRQSRAQLAQAIERLQQAELKSSSAATKDRRPLDELITLARNVLNGTGEKSKPTLADFLAKVQRKFASRLDAASSSADLQLSELLRQPLAFDGAKLADRDGLFQRLHTAILSDGQKCIQWHRCLSDELQNLLGRLANDPFGENSSSASSDSYEQFNHWLRRVALADVFAKAHVTACACAADRSNSDELKRIAPPLDIETLEKLARESRDRRDDVRRELRPLQISTSARQRRQNTTERVHIRELGPLFAAIHAGIFAPALVPGDEGAVRDAVRHRTVTTVRDLQIGTDGWTSLLLSLFEQRKHLLETIRPFLFEADEIARQKAPIAKAAHISDPVFTPAMASAQTTALLCIVEESMHLAPLELQAAQHFEKLLEQGPLGLALQELLNLLTPASWAYPSLTTKVDVTGQSGEQAQQSLEFNILGHDAATILNTAELKTLALALFLLCAPCVDNPYRVLLLDDPLENMDELKVTTVARGLARVLRLWQNQTGDISLKEWDIILLLHGEENCERIVRECAAARYQFPWLAPVGQQLEKESAPSPETAADMSVKFPEDVYQLPGSEEGKLLPLDNFIAISPKRA